MLVDYCCVNGLELLVCKMVLGIQLLLKLSLRLMELGCRSCFFVSDFCGAYGISIDVKQTSCCLKIFHRDKNVDQYQIVLIQNNDRIRYKLIFYISRRKT